MTTIAKNTTAQHRRSRLYAFRWLTRLDAAYRQHHALKHATPEHLDDMGISLQEANAAFYRQFADKKLR